MTRRGACRLALVALLGAGWVLASAAPAGAHGVGGIEPSNFETTIRSVSPRVAGVEVRVVDIGDRLELRNTTGRDVVVLGYDGEPYLRVGPDGVYRNRLSPATYLNHSRDTPQGPVRARADADAPPRWQRIDDGTVVRWHDHRAHWMGSRDPVVVRRDPGARHLVQRFTVELDHGASTIRVRGALEWVPGPSPWPWVGVAVLAGLGVVGLARGRRSVLVTAITLAVLLVSETMHTVGTWEGTTVSAGTKLGASVYGIAAIGVGAVALIWLVRRGFDAAAPLAMFAGLALALVGGLADVTALARSQIPSSLPMWATRLEVALAIGLGLGLTVVGARRLRATPARLASGTTMPAGPGNPGSLGDAS